MPDGNCLKREGNNIFYNIEIRIHSNSTTGIEEAIVSYIASNTIVSFREIRERFSHLGRGYIRKILKELSKRRRIQPISNGRYYVLSA